MKQFLRYDEWGILVFYILSYFNKKKSLSIKLILLLTAIGESVLRS